MNKWPIPQRWFSKKTWTDGTGRWLSIDSLGCPNVPRSARELWRVSNYGFLYHVPRDRVQTSNRNRDSNVHSIVHLNMHMHSICRYMRFTAAFKQQWATFSEPCLGKLLNEVMAIRGIHFLVTVHSHASHITAKYGITWPAHRSGLPMHSTCSVYTVTYTM